MPRIAIIAGEASGDRLGAGLVAALREKRAGLEFEGVTGPSMRSVGVDTWFDSEELAVMGLVEVARHLPRILARRRDVMRLLADRPPDLLLGIDAPDFNLPLEKHAAARGIVTAHYVSPSVWAWRQGRVKTLRSACGTVLCLLPFEAEFLERHGVPADFVGHPLADEIAAAPAKAPARASLGLGDGAVVAILPGSRHSELERLGGAFLGAARWLDARVPGIRFVAPMATPSLRDAFAGLAAREAPGIRLSLLDGQVRTAVPASDAVLLASGTATLECMLLERPMVIAYRIAPLTWQLVRRLNLIKVDHIGLPNLLAGERLVPELLQDEATPEALGAAVLAQLERGAPDGELVARFREIRARLGGGASERAADAVLRVAGLAG